MKTFYKRTWAEIDLDALHFNLKQIRGALGAETEVMAVVKADAYGHGDRMIAQTLEQSGVSAFAVSNINEAISLRRHGVHGKLLILGYTPPEAASDLADYRISQTVFSSEYARQLNAACVADGVTVNCHIKLDTGMSRIGFCTSDAETAANEIAGVCMLSNLNCCGLFSHFSSADTHDADSDAYTAMQEGRYLAVRDALASRGIRFASCHMQNSAGIAFCKAHDYQYARAGIILYGCPPSGETLPFPLKPVMKLYSIVSMVKNIPADTAVSYNRTFVSGKPMRIATVPIGYADGYPRLLSNKGFMLLHGKRAPIIGNICMDQLMLDVSDIPNAAAGDTVTVVGQDGNETLTFSDLASLCGTINYEMMCLIGKRVPRVYRSNGETCSVLDYLSEE